MIFNKYKNLYIDTKPRKWFNYINIDKFSKKNRQTGKKEVFAYTIKDKAFADFKILNTANAWFSEKVKVINLINAYKIDATDKEACAYAGISIDQLKYFNKLHPNFSTIKDTCKQLPCLKARKTINDNLSTDVNIAFKYMEKKRTGEFGNRLDLTSKGKEIKNNQITFVDFSEDK